MIVTTEKNPKPDTAAETEPADDAGDDVENAIAEQAGEQTDEAETDEAEDGANCSPASVAVASAASGPGGATCVAACCRCYSLPPLPFRASWAGGNGRSIR